MLISWRFWGVFGGLFLLGSLMLKAQPVASPVSSSWQLIDSVVLRSAPGDTIREAWPYVLDGRFYLLNPTWPRAYGFDQAGNLVARFEAPGQADSLEKAVCLFGAMVQVDSLVGIYESALTPLKLYWPDGRFHSQVLLATQPDTGLSYYVNALDRTFGYLQGHFYNYAYPGAVNHDTRRFYTLPFCTRHSRDGKQVVPFGERDSVYHQHFLPHHHEAYLAVDPYAGEILVGEEATSQMAVYDLQGKLQYRFGKAGKYIADQAIRDYQFEGEENSRAARAYFLDLYFGSPGYSYVYALEDYRLRMYRRGVADQDSMENFLDKPHFIQVYDRDNQLVVDLPAPDDYFVPAGHQGE